MTIKGDDRHFIVSTFCQGHRQLRDDTPLLTIGLSFACRQLVPF